MIAIAHLGPGNEKALDAEISVIQLVPNLPIEGMVPSYSDSYIGLDDWSDLTGLPVPQFLGRNPTLQF